MATINRELNRMSHKRQCFFFKLLSIIYTTFEFEVIYKYIVSLWRL